MSAALHAPDKASVHAPLTPTDVLPSASHHASPSAAAMSEATEAPSSRVPIPAQSKIHLAPGKESRSTETPQLCERDSIFATNYNQQSSESLADPSDRPSRTRSTPEVEQLNGTASMPTSAAVRLEKVQHSVTSTTPSAHGLLGETLHSRRQSRASLPGVELLRKHYIQQESSSIKPEGSGADGGHPPFMSPVQSPFDRPSTPYNHDFSSNPAATELQDHRFSYRAWREGKPVRSSKKNTAPQHYQIGLMEMDRRIDATMPKAESKTANRSRKTSHHLGIFKENETAQAQKRRDDRQQGQTFSAKAHKEQDKGPSRETGFKLTATEPDVHPASAPQTPFAQSAALIPGSASVESTSWGPKNEDSAAENVLPGSSERGSYSDDGHSIILEGVKSEVLSGRSNSLAFPMRLSEEIRERDNLTPSPERGTSLSKNIRTLASERTTESVLTKSSPEQVIEEGKRSLLSEATERGGSGVGKERDDSEGERISSALYIPHRAPKPGQAASSDARAQHRNVSTSRLGSATSGKNLAEERQMEQDTDGSSDVEVSLRSEGQNQCLHGAVSLSRRSSADQPGSQYSSASEFGQSVSESDHEFSEDVVTTVSNYEAAIDDLNTTPTATPLPKTHSSELKHRQQPRPPAAVGAVELMPYNHQVGGHTTVYRFSRRAVCKHMNSKENEFYETVEVQHPELLPFLPR